MMRGFGCAVALRGTALLQPVSASLQNWIYQLKYNIMSYKKCYNCGADEGLHHSETKQCPKNGIEETRFDRLTGKFYPQQWEETIFEDADVRKLELAAPKMVKALKVAKAQLEYHIEFGGGHGGEAKVLHQIEDALRSAGESVGANVR
jgi:hypothetical protein